MRTVIVVSSETDKEQIHVYAFLTTLCKQNPHFSYYYLKRQKFPFSYKGWWFSKKEI